MAIKFIIFSIILTSGACLISMFYKIKSQARVDLSWLDIFKLAISGIVAFIADTLGIGSFAINVVTAKLFGTFNDVELPAVSNSAQVLPGALAAIFFMQWIKVDLVTLLTLTTGACCGGFIGSTLASRLSKQSIRLAMIVCFTFIISLLIIRQLHLFASSADVVALDSWMLVLGFIGMILCGMFTSVGVGPFVTMQGLLFLLHVSPFVAFPIMTTAAALQQPIITLVFLNNDKIPLKKTLILSFFGCLGVLIALPIFMNLSVNALREMLLLILIYNLYIITKSYYENKLSNKKKLIPEMI